MRVSNFIYIYHTFFPCSLRNAGNAILEGKIKKTMLPLEPLEACANIVVQIKHAGLGL